MKIGWGISRIQFNFIDMNQDQKLIKSITIVYHTKNFILANPSRSARLLARSIAPSL
ncbi:hypothetical protein Hanom_Chr09g00856911 [Helianthus anomalus]